MGSIGFFLPILVVFCVSVAIMLGLIDKWLEPKSFYEKWLEEELRENPDYINWLKRVDGGKNYKLGLKVLAKIKRNESSSYHKWLKRMRKIGKY